MFYFLLTLVLSSVTIADTSYDYPFKDPYVATLVSAANGTTYKGYKTLSFEYRQDRREVPLFENRNKIALTLFKQNEPAPLAFVVSGLGGGGTSGTSLLLAEILFKAGYHVVTLPNSFSWQYLLGVSESGLPGYLPVDGKEFYKFLQGVDQMLRSEQNLNITSYSILGYSFGANLTAFIMAEDVKQNVFSFKTALLINPPVNLARSMMELDTFYDFGKSMKESRRNYIFGLLQKTAMDLWKSPSGPETLLKAVAGLNLSNYEIKWVIGQTYRESLLDVVLGSQQIHDAGLLKNPATRYSRDERIEEAQKVSYEAYLKTFVYPQLAAGMPLDDFINSSSLSSVSDLLKKDKRIYVMHNNDDIFLEVNDLTSLKKVFGSRMIVYPYGGHLGNLWMKQNQEDILRVFSLGLQVLNQ